MPTRGDASEDEDVLGAKGVSQRFIPAFQRKRPTGRKVSDAQMPPTSHQLSANSSPPGWQKWQVYLALVVMILTLATVIFKAGIEDASLSGRVERLEYDVKRISEEYERKDVVEERLSNIEKSEARVEANEQTQGDTLERLLVRLGAK